MKVLRDWRYGFLALGALLLLGLVFVKTRPTGSAPSTPLPDGSVVTLEKVTFGKNHVYTLEPEWRSALRARLPGFLSKFLGDPKFTARQTFPKDYLVIWLVRRGPPPVDLSSSPFWDHFETVDEHGCRFPIQSWGNNGGRDFQLTGLYAENFPRRGPSFTLNVYGAGRAPLASFQVPNPVAGPFPRWRAEELPITRKSGEFELTLADLKAHRSPTGECYAAPRFEVRRNGAPDSEWGRQEVRYSDETGNESYALCPFEPVWKMDVMFYRTIEARFAESEIWRLRGLPVPTPGHLTAINQAHDLNGISIEALVLAGAGSYRFSNRVCVASAPFSEETGEGTSSSSMITPGGMVNLFSISRKYPVLLCVVQGLKSSQQLLIRATEDNGRVFQCETRGGMGNNEMFFSAPWSTNAAALDLEFIPQTALEAQYLVDPRPRIVNEKAR